MSSWMERYLAPLVGARVTTVGEEAVDDGEPNKLWPTITVKAVDGRIFILQLSRDEEGNGPGFVFGLPEPLDPDSASFSKTGKKAGKKRKKA